MSGKKVVGRNVAIALGIICTLLFSIGALFTYFSLTKPQGSSPSPQTGMPLSWENEPNKHKQAREQITVKSSSYHPDETLEWYLIRVSPSGAPLDMVTCTYVLLCPGKGIQGDIDAYIEIFNPANTQWSKQETIEEMVIEYARFGFAKQKIELRDGRVFEFPEVTGEDVKQIGYLTFRVGVD
jgi:hypothetical protein